MISAESALRLWHSRPGALLMAMDQGPSGLRASSPTMKYPATLSDGESVQHALSVDVEDYFHVEAFADRVSPNDWAAFPSRVEKNTRRLLELFARHGARATFFILGWVAERQPALIKEIRDAGHELGCHSYSHSPLWRFTPEQFRHDTVRAVNAIEQVSGTKVHGFRAPTFSVVERTLWGLEVLQELGFRYDSSVFPTTHDTYGIPAAPRFTFAWKLGESRSIYEVPISTARHWGRNWPGGGGGYLRMLPLPYTQWVVRSIKSEGRPLNVYLHPWEIDPEQPRIRGRIKSRLRHYSNLDKMENRLALLLAENKFAPVQEILESEIRRREIPVLSISHPF